MRLLFCHDKYYARAQNGTVLSYGAFPYRLWEHRFLPHFESMTVIGRKKKLSSYETGILEVSSGKNVAHILLPNIASPVKKVLQSQRIYKKVEEQVRKADAVIIRGPVELGILAARAARRHNIPYAVEMSGCAYDRSYYDGSTFGKLYAPIKYHLIQDMVLHADAVIYVTEKFLQSRYPTNGSAQYASNVEIDSAPEYVLANRLKRIEQKDRILNFGLIGDFNGGFKGLSEALDALELVQQQIDAGRNLPDFRFKILGHGTAAQWQDKIRDCGLEGKVEFCGRLTRGQPVLEWLDEIDLYLHPSFYEGLPRTLIEAMSRGCPALSSDAGGASELIENAYIHPRGDAQALASHIIGILGNGNCTKQARRNFEHAKNYSRERLVPRRYQFWSDFAALAKSKQAEKQSSTKTP